MYVLVKQKGIPAGINGKERRQENAAELYEESLHRAASLDPKAYESLVEDLAFLTDKGKSIDPSKPGNMLIDLENGRLSFVDIGDNNYKADIRDLYVMLTTRGFDYKGSNREAVIQLKQEIMGKLITAYETLGIRSNTHPSIDLRKEVQGERFDPTVCEEFAARLENIKNLDHQTHPKPPILEGPTSG